MTSTSILSPKISQQFEALRDLLKQTINLAETCKDSEGAQILRDRLSNLQAAALLVIVGEVKAGKSSFINSLLGCRGGQEVICPEDAAPCTAVVQEIGYGEEPTTATLGNDWVRIRLKNQLLRDVTIVDTPGTNSIVLNHQIITENYIPRSDLVIFIFQAKSPYTATAWQLLTLIRKDWHRKVVFVLQQADIASEYELSTAIKSVTQYARERNVQDPKIFAVSAKWEREGKANSGYEEFRQFLKCAIEQGEIWRIKVEGVRDIALQIQGRLLSDLRKERQAIAEDLRFYQELLSKLESYRAKANSLRNRVVNDLSKEYERLTRDLEKEFSEGLEVVPIMGRCLPWRRSITEWLEDLQKRFDKKVAEQVGAEGCESRRASDDLSNEMKTVLDMLMAEVGGRQKGDNKGLAVERLDVHKRLRERFEKLSFKDIGGGRELEVGELGSHTLAGGGIAAIGTAMIVWAKLMILDITGGILTAVGGGVILITLLWKRSSIQRQFSENLKRARAEFRERLEAVTTDIFGRFFDQLDHSLREPLERFTKQGNRIDGLIREAGTLYETARQIEC